MRDMGHLDVTARMKRLSDILSASIRELYSATDVDIESSWHLVFLYLRKKHTATVTELAKALHVSKPAMTQMLQRMRRRGYLETMPDDNDARKKQFRLSEQARSKLSDFGRVWGAGQDSIREILDTQLAFLEALAVLDD